MGAVTCCIRPHIWVVSVRESSFSQTGTCMGRCFPLTGSWYSCIFSRKAACRMDLKDPYTISIVCITPSV